MNLETALKAFAAHQRYSCEQLVGPHVPRLNPGLQLQQYSPSHSTALGVPCPVAHSHLSSHIRRLSLLLTVHHRIVLATLHERDARSNFCADLDNTLNLG